MGDNWSTPWRPLRDGEIRDAGYGEFMVTEAFAIELLDGGMTHINGAPVRLKVVERFPALGEVQLRWTPTETLEEMAADVATTTETRAE